LFNSELRKNKGKNTETEEDKRKRKRQDRKKRRLERKSQLLFRNVTPSIFAYLVIKRRPFYNTLNVLLKDLVIRQEFDK
jgi:hypothetical protein